MDSKFRSRKFLLTAFIAIASVIALFVGKLDGGNFAGVASACVVAYSFANAAVYFKDDRK